MGCFYSKPELSSKVNAIILPHDFPIPEYGYEVKPAIRAVRLPNQRVLVLNVR